MTTTITKLRHPDDFEALGNRTMKETGDQIATQNICALHLQAFAHELQPAVSRVTSAIQVVKGRQCALMSHLYDRLEPVRDAAMLAFVIMTGLLGLLILVAALASLAGHTMTFYLFGLGPFVSLILGLALTGITTAAGYQAYEKIFVHHKLAEIAAILVAFLLCFWGLFQMAEARGTMMEKLTSSTATQSYVDGASIEDAPAEVPHEDGSTEHNVRGLLGSAMVKIMIAADIILDILLGRLVKIWTDEDFVAWQDLKKSTRDLGHLEGELNELQSAVEIAKKRCMAGILRAKHTQRKKCIPYHQALPMLLALVLLASPLFAQTIAHHEGILLDVSGSIGKGGANNPLFREYQFAVKKLLLSEPPESRVWVSVITTESFGSVSSLVKGWTPDAQGVFTDDLTRARRQLAATFEAKSAGLSPTAAGTDIIGALWQMKALLESGSSGTAAGMSKEIWVVSDMMNESASFNMPALLPTGPEAMLARAQAAGLVVPLHGYAIHVIGASPSGLTPQAWNMLRAFWMLYFREAGAQLVSYSVESNIDRGN